MSHNSKIQTYTTDWNEEIVVHSESCNTSDAVTITTTSDNEKNTISIPHDIFVGIYEQLIHYGHI